MTAEKPTGLFVDLDGTLHDYAAVARIARARLAEHVAERTALPRDEILCAYEAIAAEEHGAASGTALRLRRMELLCARLGADLAAGELAAVLGNALSGEICVYPGALDALAALKREYRIVIVTEGHEDVQTARAQQLGLRAPESQIFVTGEHGVRKRDGSAYRAALAWSGFAPERTVMIGDNWDWDIAAAAACGLSQIWISHGKTLPSPAPAGFLGVTPDFSGAAAILGGLAR